MGVLHLCIVTEISDSLRFVIIIGTEMMDSYNSY